MLFVYGTAQPQDCNVQEYLGIDKEFKKNDVVYLYGDNVKLRSEPSTKSESHKLLKIGEELTILEKSNERLIFRGVDWPWYKVKYNNLTGYVIGGLISLGVKEMKHIRCFVSSEMENDKIYIVTRVLTDSSTKFQENKTEMLADNYGFCLKLFDNRGVEGIENIIFVNYMPESGGANSGGFYLFYDGESLLKAIDVTSRGDIGFWESENLIFPNDDKGKRDKIIYRKEKVEYEDDDDNWTKTLTITGELFWDGRKLVPDSEILAKKIE